MGSYLSTGNFSDKFHNDMSLIATKNNDIYTFESDRGRVLVTKYDDTSTIVIVYDKQVIVKHIPNHNVSLAVTECVNNINGINGKISN